MSIALVLAALVCVLCAGFAALIASGKGRSVGGFALAGFLLGPVGLLYAAYAFRADELTRTDAELDRRAERTAKMQRLTGWPRT